MAMRAFIGLGANLDDPVHRVTAALAEIGALPDTRLVGHSSLYVTAPVGYARQPDFINAVAEISTGLGPRDLLDRLLAIERGHGRVRSFRNAPRSLDLDLLLYGDVVHREIGLTLPHARMTERAFVMLPLAEIAPDVMVPGHGRIGALAMLLDASGVRLYDPNAHAVGR